MRARLILIAALMVLSGCGGGSSGNNNVGTVDPIEPPPPVEPPPPPPPPPPPVEPPPPPPPVEPPPPPPPVEPPPPPPPVEPPPPPPPEPTGTALLSWVPPTEREDGSPLINLAGYRVFYGQDSEDLDIVVELDNPGLTSYLIEFLGLGTWYFSMTALDDEGRESAPSDIASKTIS
jgi:hypothetical protein